jgi:hypothetical protein
MECEMSDDLKEIAKFDEMDYVEDHGWCVICDKPLKGTSWLEVSPGRFAHAACHAKEKLNVN